MDGRLPMKPTPLSSVTGTRDGLPSAGLTMFSSRAGQSSSSTSDSEATSQPVLVQEYSLRVPKTSVRPISIMRFNGALGVDPSKWTTAKMAREDNSRLHKPTPMMLDEDVPKFGAGSEYGREAREQARRRKFGLNRKKYNPEDQPWMLKLGDKINRKYKGVREGGVSENASYFIFTQAPDGAFEVFPVKQWYNFTPIQRYKSLTSEEAEQEFGRRNKIMNYFSVMVRKRMKNDDDADDEVVKLPGRKGKKATSELKVSEMEDWENSEEEEMSDDDDEDEAADKKKKKVAKGKAAAKKKKKGSDDEGLEDSDDGDEEGRELDYISDTTETESEGEADKKADIQGVDQEQALRALLDSESDSEAEDAEKKKKAADDEGEDEPGPSSANKDEEGESKDKKKKKKKKKKSEKSTKETSENLTDDDEGKGDDNFDLEGNAEMSSLAAVKVEGAGGSGAGNSRDGTPDLDNIGQGTKRKASAEISLTGSSSKKPKMEVSSVLLQSAAAEGITEESVRRYLLRKPMTVTELLHKFKSKKTKISSQDMVNVIAHILKKINPVKRVQNQKMYLYLNKL